MKTTRKPMMGEKKVTKKKVARSTTTTAKVATPEVDNEPMATVVDLDLMYVHYTKKKGGFEIYVNPQIVRAFWAEYGIDLTYDPELKMFVGQVKTLPKDGSIMFLEYANRPISPSIIKEAEEIREGLAEVDTEIETLKMEHDELRKQAISIILQHGIKTKKGRIAHKKMLTGNWITSVRQLVPEMHMKIPNLMEVEELIEMFPKHKKKLAKLADSKTQCFEIQDINQENIFEIVRKINRHDIRDIRITFKSSEGIDESAFPNCFSWDDMDLDVEQVERMVNDLPFEVKLELYNLPEMDENPLQFHYKTDQKTKPECIYCGGAFVKNTNKCEDCGLTSFKNIKKEKK
jgi:hypothetical protein